MGNSSFNQQLQASIVGIVKYSANNIASFREVPFLVMHSVKNTGMVDLNEIIIEESIQAGYKPPSGHDIRLVIEYPKNEADKYSLIPESDPFYWDELENSMAIEEKMTEITPTNQDFVHPHKIYVKLTDLKTTPIGKFKPGMIFRVVYPITAMKLAKGTKFTSKVRYFGKTDPTGVLVEVCPPGIHIPVEHIRLKLSKGKKVRALELEGVYEIVLSVMNMGTSLMTELEINDLIPPNFSWEVITKDYKFKCRKAVQHDQLIWLIPMLQPNEKITICYRVQGKGAYTANKDQFE